MTRAKFSGVVRGLLSLTFVMQFCMHASGEKPSYIPDAETQSALHKIIQSQSEPTALRLIGVLDRKYRGQRNRLVLELNYLASRASDVDEAMAPAALAPLLGIEQQAIALALAPYIDSDDVRFSEEARGWIIATDMAFQPPREGTRLRALVQKFARDNKPVPAALTSFMFERNPRAALQDFMSAYLPRDPPARSTLIWADHVIQDAIWRDEKRFYAEFEAILAKAEAQLDWMSRHDASWVRLYVAVVLAKHPKLRNDEVVARLLKDADEAVRNQAAAATDDKPQKNGAKK